jgi:hypothetical protein
MKYLNYTKTRRFGLFGSGLFFLQIWYFFNVFPSPRPPADTRDEDPVCRFPITPKMQI